ncbi:unnamed protein product [Allacma fusca]|uniref:PI3K/PI4K catalytic domain-containing protein n=1 Tax=Allacma fusca TaxID=39272 RepID=A0A8J2LTH4_9HEXA|nr:unnamed protein product [Allacma fusca]
MEQIVGILKDLHKTTEATPALDILQQLREYLTNLTDYSKIDHLIAAVFHSEEDGILAYFWGHLGKKEHDKPKREGLNILQLMLENTTLRTAIAQFSLRIFNLVTILFENHSSESAAVQQEALECVMLILEKFKNRIIREDYGLKKFYMQLIVSSEKSTYTPSVRGKIFQCLGLVASFGHDSFLSEEPRFLQLLNLYVFTVNVQVESINQKMEASILQGCIKGLHKFLDAFCSKISTEQPLMKKFYENLEQIVDPKCSFENDAQTVKLKRREFQRSGLDFVAHHANYLREGLFENHKYWFAVLLTWAKSNNIDDSKVGTKAMFRFLETVSAYVKTITKSGDILQKIQASNEFFAETFKRIMESQDKHRTELTVAIKGIGFLCDIYDDINVMELLYKKMIEHIEAVIIELNMPVVDKYSGSNSLVQSYLEASGRMLFNMKMVSEDDRKLFEKRLLIVENLSVLLITSYPDLSEKYRHFAPNALLKVVHGLLASHYSHGEPFVERVIQEGLTHIIASPTQVEADILVESYNQQTLDSGKHGNSSKSVYNTLGLRTVKFYTKFWIGLVENVEPDYKASCETIYNAVIDWTLKTIGKLDLSVQFVEDDEDDEIISTTDPIHQTKATVVKDFQLFVNIVDFLCDFVQQTKPVFFENWIELFVNQMLDYIKAHSLVSGFYRIMALVFEIMRKLKYFHAEDREDIYERCCKFLASLSAKIQEFRDDLLLAILDVWLAAPDKIILSNIKCLGETLQAVFRLGRNSFPLALRGIHAIERWFQMPDFPEDDMEKCFNKLFPLWEDYFTTGAANEDEVADINKDVKPKTKTKVTRQRLQTLVKTETQETTLGKLQLDIIRVIGSYGHLKDLDLDQESKGFSITGQCLSYSIPFQDIKVEMCLDNFFPRLMELCTKSTDRQLRTSACEIFHTFVLYYLGQQTASKTSKSDDNMNLCRNIFANLIQLGSDSDVIVRQLFNPLSLQTIHWCSKINHHFGETVLHIIIEGLVQSEDPSRRDFCCICLQEYFSWCLKHRNDSRAKQVIKMLVSLSQHAAPQYRQGSVLGFNSIYRIFREPDQSQKRQLYDQYTFQLLHSYVVSLHLSAEDSPLLICTTKQAIRHLERIILKKKDNFCVAMDHRVIPSEIKGSTLRHLVDWLLRKSGTTSGSCREECFRLINVFVPCIRGLSSVENFLNSFEDEHGRHSLIEIAENRFNIQDFSGNMDLRIRALETVSSLYAFFKKSNYAVELLFTENSSKFLSQLNVFLKDLRTLNDFPESNKVLEIVMHIGSFENILTIEHQVSLIESSALLSAKLVDKNTETLDVSETWKQLYVRANRDNIVTERSRLKQIFKLTLTPEKTDSLNRIRWLTKLAETGFLREVYTEVELNEFVEACINFVEMQLFDKPTGTSLRARQLSNRMKATVKAVFAFVISSGSHGNVVVKKVFDPTIVLHNQLNHVTTKGDIYQKYFISCLPFCHQVFELSKLKDEVSMERIGKLIQQLLVTVKNDKSLRKRFGEILVEKTIEIWTQLSLNCTNIVISGLISGMASLNMNLCRDSDQLSDWWSGSGLLRNVNLTLKEKSQYIHFLGLFGLSKKKNITSKVLACLADVLEHDLNARLSWKDEESCILKILQAVLTVYEEIPRNLEMLKIISVVVAKVAVISNSDKNGCSMAAKVKLVKIATCLEYKDQFKMADFLYKISTGESEEYRRTSAVIKYLLLPVLTSIGERASKEFFKKNINDIATKAALEPKSIPEWHLKIIAFQMIEVLCLFTTTQGIFFTGPELNSAYLTGLGRTAKANDSKDLARDLMKICTAFTLPSESLDKIIQKLILQCNQAAFNVLHAGLRVMQSKLSAVLNLAIKLNMNKDNKAHWNNIIDCSVEYSFPPVLDHPGPKKESSVDDLSLISKLSSNSRSNRKVMLQSSSLAIDATNYDFTAAMTVENSKFYQKIFAGANSARRRNSSVQLEWGLINEHPCMLSFVETIRNFNKKKGQAGNETVMDDLTLAISNFIKSPSVHKNVKIFLVAAVHNCKEIFQPCAQRLVSSIVMALLPPQACFGLDLNYFLKDVLVMLLEWTEVAKPSSEQVCKILKFMLPNVWHDRKDVFNQNLLILETIVSKWVKNEEEEVPIDDIASLVEQSETKVGLEVCKHFLLAGHFPCHVNSRPGSLDLKKLVACAAKTFESTSKLAHYLGAQVAGLTLREIKNAGGEQILDSFSTFLRKFLDKLKKRPQVVLYILKNIQDFFPPFITDYKPLLLQLLSNKNLRNDALRLIPGILKTEIEYSGADQVKLTECLNSMYRDLAGRGALNINFETAPETEVGVDILELFVSRIDNEEILLKLIEWTECAEKSPVASLRVRYATLVSKTYHNFSTNLHKEQSLLFTKVEKMFVRLYQDDDEAMKLIVSEFWAKKLKSWMDSPSLILELMEILGEETSAIPICISLIMKRCSLSPDYFQPLFKEDLGDCVFQQYNLDTSWRMRHSTFQPLYAESLSSSQNFPHLPQTFKIAVLSQLQTTGKFGMNLLRATLDNKLQYTPTAPGIQSNASQESMEVGNSFSSQGFYQGFNESDNLENDTGSVGSGGALAHLRKRFYERPSTQNNFYAIREIERQEAAVERQVDAIRTKRSGVKLMRSYRIGELPDIMMKNSDFLTALSSLTKTDLDMGRLLLVHLFTAIMKRVNSKGVDTEEKFKESAKKSFNSILANYGIRLSPEFAAAIIEISLINDVSIQPHLISDVCRNFELQPLAILKLEKDLGFEASARHPEPKKARLTGGIANPEADILLRIAELYKDLDDFDAVRNVFVMAGQAYKETKELYDRGAQALRFESLCKFDEALELYGNLCVEESPDCDKLSEIRLQFWDSSVYKCLKQLSNWEQVFERAESYCQDSGTENVFDNIEYLDQILPNQLTAAVQILIRDQSHADEEPEVVVRARLFLEQLLQKEDSWENILSEYVDLPVVSAVFHHEVGHTLSWLDKSMNKSVEAFCFFGKFSKSQKNEQLLTLQRAAVLQDYLQWCKSKKSSCADFEIQTSKLITKWNHSGKPKSSCLSNLDMIVAQKDNFITSMAIYLEEHMSESNDHLIRELQLINFDQYMQLADLSITTGNEYLARQTFQKAKEIGRQDTFIATWQKLYCRYLSSFSDATNWDKMWAASWKNLRKLEGVDHENEIKTDLLRCLFEKFSQGPLDNDRRIRSALSADSSTDLIQHVVSIATTLAQTVAKTFVEVGATTGIHMKLYNLLKVVQCKLEVSLDDKSEIDKILLISLLQGMQTGSTEALHLFPTTFPVIERYPELANILFDQVKHIPTWMFLPWLDQIFVNYTHSRTLKPSLNFIIQQLITDFPQAFQLEYSNVLKGKKLPQVYALYSEALNAVTLPSVLFQEYFQPLKSAKEVEKCMEKCKRKLQDVQEKSHIYGNLHQSFVNKLIPKLDTHLKQLKQANKHSSSDDSQEMESEREDSFAIRLWNRLRQEEKVTSDDLESKINVSSRPINLENLSPWLARFRSSAYEDYLEVPGLYSKFEMPHVMFHPKVMSFHPTILLLPSLTKPIRLTMVCNNGKEVRFLVKKGDDLRQDKRIQQCFHVANEIFKVDPPCKARKLQIITYAIIPCTTNFGLIEWVDKTVSLKGLVLNSRNLENQYNEQKQSYINWMTGFTRSNYSTNQNKSRYDTYHINAEVVGRELAEKKFDDIAGRLSDSLLREHVLQGCKSLENYFAIRERMIRSYATMCFVHWLLGIGDRHLENCLISTESGEFLGIDFGRSFGIALFKQDIPELIPFRLTPQIQNFLQPYGCNGLFKETMICVKRSMKISAELLTAVADVFIKEPLADWLKIRSHNVDEAQTESESPGLSSWDPIKTLKSKLAGENPLTITVQEIQYMNEKLRRVYTKIVRDGREAIGDKTHMTDEEYVDTLIALSTDKNILIRHWFNKENFAFCVKMKITSRIFIHFFAIILLGQKS